MSGPGAFRHRGDLEGLAAVPGVRVALAGEPSRAAVDSVADELDIQ